MSLEEERCEDTEENRDEEQMMVEAETGVMSPSTEEGQDCWQPPETKRDKDPSLELWREMALQQLDLDF